MLFLKNFKLSKGHVAFAVAFVSLSLATSALPTSSAVNPLTSDNDCEVDCVAYNSAVGGVVFQKTAAEVAIENTPKSSWGNPVFEDDFNRTKLGDGWFVYDSPNGDPKRYSSNVNIDGNFANLLGTYQNKVVVGSGVSQKFSQKYGRWEVRMRADKGGGFSPTALLWPDNDDWPAAGEIDLIESPHANRERGIAVIHNKTASNFKSQKVAGSQVDWHTYAVDWLPDHVTFYVDDVEQWTVTDPKLIPTKGSMHLVLQNDAGCGWIECPNSSTKPVTAMQVDWIKVYAAPAS